MRVTKWQKTKEFTRFSGCKQILIFKICGFFVLGFKILNILMPNNEKFLENKEY